MYNFMEVIKCNNPGYPLIMKIKVQTEVNQRIKRGSAGTQQLPLFVLPAGFNPVGIKIPVGCAEFCGRVGGLSPSGGIPPCGLEGLVDSPSGSLFIHFGRFFA